MKIKVAGRDSPLSNAQIDEVLDELLQYHQNIAFEKILMKTTGDFDLKTSLRDLDKTDFFTRQVDECLMKRRCHIAVHSAKDLPKTVPEGLSIIAITKGVDPRDSLVLKEGITLKNLRQGAVIGTSSKGREEALLAIRPDLEFMDVRGPIHKRLEYLQQPLIDGVVIAEAAIIRLKLQLLNRVILENKTAPLQGRLAIIARSNDTEMQALFACLNAGH